MSETRKLAAMPVADVLGSSLFAGADEGRARARLRDKLAEVGKTLCSAARPLRLMFRTLVLVDLMIWALCGAAVANDPCTAQPKSFIYTCSGNQSAGVAFNAPSPPSGATIVPSNANGINITNLTSNITGPVSINVQPSSTGPFPVTFSDPNYSIVLPQSSTSGILETALNQRLTATPGPLQILSLIVNGSVNGGGTNAPAIALRSQAAGGSGGSSKAGNGDSGDPGFFPRSVDLTLGAAADGQPPTNGVVTQLGGSASPATPAILATSVGGKGGSGGAGGSNGGNGGQGRPGETVSGTTSGTWSVSGVQTGLLLVSQGGQGGREARAPSATAAQEALAAMADRWVSTRIITVRSRSRRPATPRRAFN